VSKATASARAAIEEHGGTLTTVYYNELGLRGASRLAFLISPFFHPTKQLVGFCQAGTSAVSGERWRRPKS